LKQGGSFMRRILQKNEKIELNSFIEEFVKVRQKYFTPGQEWLEAELPQEKISVYMDKAQLEKDLDDFVKTSLMYGKVQKLVMEIQVKKTADGAEICFSDNGAGNWRNEKICVMGKPGRSLEMKKNWGVQVA
jgi:C4-dicarboxylate-specific signal transduction histidine kinase